MSTNFEFSSPDGSFVTYLTLETIIDELYSEGDWVKNELLDWIGKEYTKEYFDLKED